MDLATGELALVVVVVFAGAFVRGLTGFGAALTWVSGLILVMPADEAVPLIFLLDVGLSATLLPKALPDVDWGSTRWLMVGAVVGLPVGIAVLSAIDPTPMQAVVSVVVLVSVIALWFDRRLERDPPRAGVVATGVVSGVLNGATSAGGPPVITFFLASPSGMRVGRASLTAYFGGMDIVGTTILAATGHIGSETLLRALLGLPALVAGGLLGGRRFEALSEDTVRRVALVVLAVLAIVGLLRL